MTQTHEQIAIDPAWAEVSERRIDHLDRGKATVIPGDVVPDRYHFARRIHRKVVL